ncbi:MAG: ABC transporter substrate-binding protein [Hyphomicrobiaceae bacterium]
MTLLRHLLCTTLAIGVASAASAEPDPRRFEGTELNMLYFEISFVPGLKQLLPEFEEMTGIKVNIETLSEAAAVQKAQVESATRTGAYDVVGMQSGNLPLYAQNGWLTPVAKFAGNADISIPDQLALDDFIPSTLQAMSYDGEQYCLPFFAATTILYYQIDKFRDAGIETPPTTYEELIDVSAKVHSADIPAIALRGAPPGTGNIWIFNSFFYGAGASYFADFPNDMTPTVNSPEAVTALETFVTLKNNYAPEGSVSFTYDDVVTAMQQGKVVMAIDGAPLAGRILDPSQSRVSDNLGFAVLPGGAAGPKPAFAAHGLCVTGASQNAAAAYMFIEWATSSETMKKVAKNSQYLATPRNSIWEDAEFREKYDYDFGGGSFLSTYQQSLAEAPPAYYPPFAAWSLVNNRIGQAVQSAEIGEATPQEALDQANEDITKLLKEEGLL